MSVYNDDVLLVHIPKCGGTSCRDYLKAHLPGCIDSIDGGPGPLPIDSTPLRHISEYTGRPLDSWKLIVIPVRNPYAQVVSHWAYHADRHRLGGNHIHDLVAAAHPTVNAWLTHPHSDFRYWYVTSVRREHPKALNGVGFYEYYATTEGGEVPKNVRFVPVEGLSKEFPELVAAYCGGVHLMPSRRSSPHRSDPMAYLNKWGIRMVNERFVWTFENFRYDRAEA